MLQTVFIIYQIKNVPEELYGNKEKKKDKNILKFQGVFFSTSKKIFYFFVIILCIFDSLNGQPYNFNGF